MYICMYVYIYIHIYIYIFISILVIFSFVRNVLLVCALCLGIICGFQHKMITSQSCLSFFTHEHRSETYRLTHHLSYMCHSALVCYFSSSRPRAKTFRAFSRLIPYIARTYYVNTRCIISRISYYTSFE
jgi:hypothetical protein